MPTIVYRSLVSSSPTLLVPRFHLHLKLQSAQLRELSTISLFCFTRLPPPPRLFPIYGLQLPRLISGDDAWLSVSPANTSHFSLPSLHTLRPTAVSLTRPTLVGHRACKDPYIVFSSLLRPTSLLSASWSHGHEHVDGHHRLLGPRLFAI